MQELSGCSAFLNVLKDEGVEFFFGNPGTTELPIMDCLVDQPELKYILGLQEAVVMAMADGYCRASGKLSCVNFHVAPGLGNAIGAMYNANFFGSPVIVTAGQQERSLSITEPMLFHELVPMAQSVVKWATEVQRPEDIPRVFRRAAKVALSPPTGPVFVSLPGDVLKGSGEMTLGARTRVDSISRPREECLEHLADRLLAAKNPVIIACHEVYSSGAMAELAALAESIGAAVYNQSVPYLAVFPTAHPLYMGEITRHQGIVRKTLENYDLLFMAGGDGLRMSVPSPVDPVPPQMPIVQIGLRNWDIGKNYPAEIALGTDVRETLIALLPILKKKQFEAHAAGAKERTGRLKEKNWSAKKKPLTEKTVRLAGEIPIDPDYLMMEIARSLPDQAVVVEEGISSVRNLLNFLPVADRHRFFGLASGGIGCGIGAAVGIKLALPDRPVVALIGDGSAMYSIQALWTAANQNLSITYVIINNGGYGILKERLMAYGGAAAASGRIIGMDFCDPSIQFVQLAAALGVPAVEITDPKKIAPAISESIHRKGPVLLDVKVRDIGR
jgi:benzoylformate decarboxylase